MHEFPPVSTIPLVIPCSLIFSMCLSFYSTHWHLNIHEVIPFCMKTLSFLPYATLVVEISLYFCFKTKEKFISKFIKSRNHTVKLCLLNPKVFLILICLTFLIWLFWIIHHSWNSLSYTHIYKIYKYYKYIYKYYKYIIYNIINAFLCIWIIRHSWNSLSYTYI